MSTTVDHVSLTDTNHGPRPFRVVLLGDLHLYRLMVPPWQLLSKRLLGQMNMWLSRGARLRRELLPVVVDKVIALQPDLVLCSGDLTTTALPGELELAHHLLEPLFHECNTILIPGNHDRYTHRSMNRRDFEKQFPSVCPQQWPMYRQLGPRLHFVAFDATRPSLLSASGHVPQEQLDRYDGEIRPRLSEDSRLIVLCHYPLDTPPGHPKESRSHALTNPNDLVERLAGPIETLYLHGHIHKPWCFRHTVVPNMICLDAGAPLMVDRRYRYGQGFWQIDLTEPGWHFQRHYLSSPTTWTGHEVAVPHQAGDVTEAAR